MNTWMKCIIIWNFYNTKYYIKKQHEESVKRFPNRRPDILKQPNFYMSPTFDEPLEDFKEYM